MFGSQELSRSNTSIFVRLSLRGYEVDCRESWAGSAVMRHSATADKIIIKRDAADGHYLFFSVRDADDSG